MSKEKKYCVRICIEELTFHDDGGIDDVTETGWSLECGPRYETEEEAITLQQKLIEAADRRKTQRIEGVTTNGT